MRQQQANTDPNPNPNPNPYPNPNPNPNPDQAHTDYLRFKDAARDKVLLVQELLRVWHAAVPPQLRQLLLSLFDLKIVEAQAMDP